jgi:hypothetical protein
MVKTHGRTVTVIGGDLGSTSGLLVVTVDKQWLRGLGDPSWEGLGHAIRSRVAYQVGEEPKMFDVDTDRATRLDRTDLNELLLPVLARQPLVEQDGGRKIDRFQAILEGEHPAGGGDLEWAHANEVIQVRQIAGLLDNYPDAALVLESFQLRTEVRSPEVLSSDRLRLAVETEEILHGMGRVPFLQTPSEMKTGAMPLVKKGSQARDYSRLKRAGLHFPGMQHATDAGGHVAIFLRACRSHEEIRAQAWPKHFKDWGEEPEEPTVFEPDAVFDSGFEVTS